MLHTIVVFCLSAQRYLFISLVFLIFVLLFELFEIKIHSLKDLNRYTCSGEVLVDTRTHTRGTLQSIPEV